MADVTFPRVGTAVGRAGCVDSFSRALFAVSLLSTLNSHCVFQFESIHYNTHITAPFVNRPHRHIDAFTRCAT
jgi:hypothetical protein